MNQKKGKIYETETYTTKCECGEIVTQEYYKKFDVDVKSDFDMFIGFCQCGNIFVAQYPMEVEKNKTRDEGPQIEVEYEYIDNGKLKTAKEHLAGLKAQLFQHAIDHANGENIYYNNDRTKK